MKLLACADLHLGAGSEYGRAPFGPESRLADQERAWISVCELAIAEAVDAVVFAGDACERRRPLPAEILAFRAGLDRLCMHGIPVFAVDGNHDVTSAYLPSVLDIFIGELELYRTPAVRDFEDVQLAFLPWTPPAQLIATRGGGDRDSLHHDVAGELVHVARGLRAECAEGKPAILVAHWSVSGASTPTGITTDQFREPVLSLTDLISLGFDAVICGHIHVHQILNEDPLVMYVGSPAVCNFGESEIEHGVVLLEVE